MQHINAMATMYILTTDHSTTSVSSLYKNLYVIS